MRTKIKKLLHRGKILTHFALVCACFVSAKIYGSYAEQSAISLNGKTWKLLFAPQETIEAAAKTPEDFKNLTELKTINASVPGNVEIDMLEAGLIDNPMIGDNVYKLRKYEGFQWMYSRTFKTPAFEKDQRVILNLEGVDTLARVFVNGKLVGSPENMFIAHSFDITNFLNKNGGKKGENTLDIILRSPVIESQKYFPSVGGGREEVSEYVNIRKCPSAFGWDIHPRLVTAGLWKDVFLKIQNPVHIKDSYWYTRKLDEKNKTATIGLDVSLAAPFSSIDSIILRATISKDGKIVSQKEEPVFSFARSISIKLENPKLWWPRGYGDAELYDCKAELVDKNSNKVLATTTTKLGVRMVKFEFEELEKTPTGELDESKGKFKFYINNVPIFVKGTNWVPLDALHSKDISHTRAAMEMAVDLNCNMIRCWGGNAYESDLFYELCDENGIMVWQDFSLACAIYPQNENFAKKIREEVEAVVRRLRGHSSIVLWAGNNEIDVFYRGGRLREFKMSPEHDQISRKIIPDALYEMDWSRSYLPSSPYLSKKVFDNPSKYALPENHLWGPRGYYKDPFYTKSKALFVSEIGYHGCPNRSSIEKMMDKEFVYPWTADGKWNRQWQAKAVMTYPNSDVHAKRNDLMTKQVKILFGEVPSDLDDFILASQCVQAEAKKYFIEMMRSRKFSLKTGILWWNLRDAWPILSDAVVDYYGSKKLAYHYIKRVQFDVCAMINDDFDLVVVNDTLSPQKGKIKVCDANSGREIFSGEYEVDANSKSVLGKIEIPEGQGVLLIDYSVSSKEKSNHYLYGKPPFEFQKYKKWLEKIDKEESFQK